MFVVLASSSPRRTELLKMIGITDFTVIPPHIDETVPAGSSPEDAVCLLALSKAEAVASDAAALAAEIGGSGAENSGQETCAPLIIAADTLVYLDGTPLGKPADTDDAKKMLRALSGRKHTVYTGVVLLSTDKSSVCVEKTDVYFREIGDEEITDYVATGEPMDKAGAYAAQGIAAMFIERIDGDFWNVVGLPLCRLSKMLNAALNIHK